MPAEAIVNFPFQEVIDRLDGVAHDDSRAAAAEGMARMVEWLSACDLRYHGDRRMRVMAVRVAVLTYALRPELIGGSLSQFARAAGLTPQAMTRHAREVVRRFGLVSPYQHSAGFHGPRPIPR